ncbi:MAG: RsmB/NOP family class I SAM-dependent RNA methyltransferase [Alphaproteobacteria bacterium]|nr:RsmB/NOP family class I SAM-dependent RNA methyltransferase [Alphaproteobacteria bacterium]
MTPAARIKACIDLLEKIAVSRIPMDGTIGDYMRVRRYIGSKDRSAIAERTYEIVRHTARLGWWLKKTGAEDTPRNRVLAWLAMGECCAPKRLKDLFDGSKYGPDKLSDEERAYVEKWEGDVLNHSAMPESVRAECPLLYEDKLRSYFGPDFVPEMEAMLHPAPLDLRVNIWRATRDKARAYLSADGVETDETIFSPWGLRARGKAYLSKTKAFAKGWIEIQDEGSQLIALACDVQPGMQVLDYCAGAGGKTLALAASMGNKGRIVAMDLEPRRLEKSRARLKKAGLADCVEIRPLSDEKNRKWLRRQKESFDLVLTDVPCSGTGTWRRNPDMRWRTYGPPLEELVDIQADILEKVAKTVKPGGRLVYATCSLLPDENERQIESFLAGHPEFSLFPLPDSLRAVCAGEKNEPVPFMRLTPYRHGTDGFFAAVLTRT